MEAACFLAGSGSPGTPGGAGLRFRSAARAPPSEVLTASAANELRGQRGCHSGGRTSGPGLGWRERESRLEGSLRGGGRGTHPRPVKYCGEVRAGRPGFPPTPRACPVPQFGCSFTHHCD